MMAKKIAAKKELSQKEKRDWLYGHLELWEYVIGAFRLNLSLYTNRPFLFVPNMLGVVYLTEEVCSLLACQKGSVVGVKTFDAKADAPASIEELRRIVEGQCLCASRFVEGVVVHIAEVRADTLRAAFEATPECRYKNLQQDEFIKNADESFRRGFNFQAPPWRVASTRP